MPYYRDDWDRFLAQHDSEFWRCGVPNHILANRSVFLSFLRNGYYKLGSSRCSVFDGTKLSDEELAQLAELVARHIDVAYRESILSRWRMERLRPLFESTCWVRYLDVWHDGREVLEKEGIDLDASIFFYIGPGGTYATVEFVGEDGKAVGLDLDRDEMNGSICIGERWSREDSENRERDEAKAIWQSGQLEWFNASVKEYLRKHYPEVST